MNQQTKKMILWICLFATAMGFLETSVVVYLRELYYPNGFDFPLTIIPKKIAVVEFWREFATIIMLVGAGIIAGKTKLSRFAYFIIAFAVWDLFYYVFLYVLLQWPQSLFTWDILFLIPFPWTGPVLAPCLVACGMILLGLLIIYYEEKNSTIRINFKQWSLLLGGVCIIILSFMWDYISITYAATDNAWTLFSQNNLFEELKTYVPNQFNWLLFFAGLASSAAGMLSCFLTWKQPKQISSTQNITL